MTNEAYSDILKKASDALSVVTTDVRIIGDDLGRFLVANLENFGVEFYVATDGFVIDTAVHDELQGEKMFQTIDEALRFASDWLTQKG
ncbi:MAG: hypothetical protein ACREC8_06425 [Limisphaerales bacterium]